MKNEQKVLAKPDFIWYKYFEYFSLWDYYTHMGGNQRETRDPVSLTDKRRIRQQRHAAAAKLLRLDTGPKGDE